MGTHLGRNESSVRSDQNQILQNLSVVNFVRGGGKVPWLRSRNRRVQVRHVRSTKAVVVGLSLTRAIERKAATNDPRKTTSFSATSEPPRPPSSTYVSNLWQSALTTTIATYLLSDTRLLSFGAPYYLTNLRCATRWGGDSQSRC